MAKKDEQVHNTGMVLVLTYFVLLTVNAVVIYLANIVFPQLVVLGTMCVGKSMAILNASGKLAILNTFAIPFIREREKRMGRMYTSRDWMIAYFLINFVGIWVLGRFAQQLGFGVASWLVVALLAGVLDVVQGIAMMQVERYRKLKMS